MKKILIVLIIVLVFSFAACGGGASSDNDVSVKSKDVVFNEGDPVQFENLKIEEKEGRDWVNVTFMVRNNTGEHKDEITFKVNALNNKGDIIDGEYIYIMDLDDGQASEGLMQVDVNDFQEFSSLSISSVEYSEKVDSSTYRLTGEYEFESDVIMPLE